MTKAGDLLNKMNQVNESLGNKSTSSAKPIDESANKLKLDDWKSIVKKEYPNSTIKEVTDPEDDDATGWMVCKNPNDGIQSAFALWWNEGNYNTKDKHVADGQIQS